MTDLRRGNRDTQTSPSAHIPYRPHSASLEFHPKQSRLRRAPPRPSLAATTLYLQHQKQHQQPCHHQSNHSSTSETRVFRSSAAPAPWCSEATNAARTRVHNSGFRRWTAINQRTGAGTRPSTTQTTYFSGVDWQFTDPYDEN